MVDTKLIWFLKVFIFTSLSIPAGIPTVRLIDIIGGLMLCGFFGLKNYPKLFGRRECYTQKHALSCMHIHSHSHRESKRNQLENKSTYNIRQTTHTHSLTHFSSVFCLLGSIQLQVLFFVLLFSVHFFTDQRHCSLTLDVLC